MKGREPHYISPPAACPDGHLILPQFSLRATHITNTIRDILGHRRCSLYRVVSYERELQAMWENHRMRKGV